MPIHVIKVGGVLADTDGNVPISGVKGDKGDTGLTGPKGDTGEQGPQGIPGPGGGGGSGGSNTFGSGLTDVAGDIRVGGDVTQDINFNISGYDKKMSITVPATSNNGLLNQRQLSPQGQGAFITIENPSSNANALTIQSNNTALIIRSNNQSSFGAQGKSAPTIIHTPGGNGDLTASLYLSKHLPQGTTMPIDGNGHFIQFVNHVNPNYLRNSNKLISRFLKADVHDERISEFSIEGSYLAQDTIVFKLRGDGLLNIKTKEFADNSAALSNGLVAGDVYRTGDFLKIVH